jgi:Ca-activated chloride channel family protein
VLRSEKWTRNRASSFLTERALRKIGWWGCPGVLVLLVASLLFAQEAPIRQGPPLKISVNRVSVGVTVSDAGGRFMHDLQRSDFRIYDNGTEQPIADFLPVEEPAQVLLLIEGGPSVLFFAKNHVLAADQMVASLAPDDRVAIATYTKGPESVIGFTTDKTEARLALRGISFAQGFGELNLFDGVANAVDALGQLPGKKTIVLLSTGVDTSPDINWDALLPKLQITDVRIIAVSLSGDIRKPAKKKRLTADEKTKQEQLAAGFAEGDQSLRNLSHATGGRVYFVRNEKDFAKTYTEIADLLRHEYSVAFVPPMLDGKIHELRVEVKQPGVVVEHRPAYLAAASGEVH